MEEIKNFFDEKEKQDENNLKAKLLPKDRARLYREQKLKENPNWDKERMKRWRTKHKDTYHYGQAKHHFSKLTSEQKQRLLHDVEA